MKEIVELEYLGEPIKKTVLFNCEWYDSTLNRGMNIDKKYKLVEVNTRRRFHKYEPFVLAAQAVQVYFCTYPSKNRNRANWEAVCKVKARGNIDMPESSTADVIVPPF